MVAAPSAFPCPAAPQPIGVPRGIPVPCTPWVPSSGGRDVPCAPTAVGQAGLGGREEMK